MENKANHPDFPERNYPRGNYFEIRLSPIRTNLLVPVWTFLLIIFGCLLFNFIWAEATAYSFGYKIGLITKLWFKDGFIMWLIPWSLIYLGCQYGLLYWLGGKDRRAIRFDAGWLAVGWKLVSPIPLKYYRVSLAVPMILLCMLPLFHGLCSGDFRWYSLGLLGIIAASSDLLTLWRLRLFDDEDLLVNGERNYDYRIIRRIP